MNAKRFTVRALAVAALYAGFGIDAVLALPPAPKVEEMAAVQPKQAGVEVTLLAAGEAAKCRVEAFPNAQAPVGFVLLDSSNRPVRRFVAISSQNFNILSFYLDGEEVYRETDSKAVGKVDQFRWLGSNGGKIGRDLDGNGSIDVWDSISAEEVSKELFDAIVSKDANKLKALQPSEAELKSIGLPPAEIGRLQARMANAPARLTATATAAGLTAKSKWIHVEFFLPETTPFDAFGGTQDIVRHRNGGGVLFDKGDGKSADFFQTGELIRIGNAGRVIDGPANGTPQTAKSGGEDAVPPAIKPLIDELINLKQPSPPTAKYQMDRAAILEKIVAALTGHAGQETWMRQMLDAYGSAAELGDKIAFEKLTAWKDQIVKHAPNSPIAGFAIFRHASVDYFIRLRDAKTQAAANEAQKWWRDELEKFIKDYPAIDETPEAYFRLAMANEYNGKDGDKIAAGYYETLVQKFPQHPQAPQAQGAANRLKSEGKPFSFVGSTTLDGKPFNQATLAGKATLVYFWGSFSAQNGKLKEDADVLAALAKKHAGKLEIITVAVDAPPQQAQQAIAAAGLPGTHLGSSNGQMATSWGIMGQHLFLLDKTGKVDNKNASLSMVGEEIERLVK